MTLSARNRFPGKALGVEKGAVIKATSVMAGIARIEEKPEETTEEIIEEVQAKAEHYRKLRLYDRDIYI